MDANNLIASAREWDEAMMKLYGKPYLVGAIRSYKSYSGHNAGHSLISLVNYSEFKAAAGLK